MRAPHWFTQVILMVLVLLLVLFSIARNRRVTVTQAVYRAGGSRQKDR